jgi:hypothetical protein
MMQKLVRLAGSRVASRVVATALFLSTLPSVAYGQQLVCGAGFLNRVGW